MVMSPNTSTPILVVDDHPGVRCALESLLSAAGDLQVVGSACCGADAVTLAARLRPSVVIMDLAMPGMNGVEATRHICVQHPPPIVVALSGSRELWREAIAAGASYTLLKETDPEHLLETIRAAAMSPRR